MNSQPLAGKRVIELGTMIAAPFATHILASLGAEVIKVEPPSGDTTRSLVRGGPSGTIVAYSHGKKDICLDLTTAEGKQVFLRLAASADVVNAENGICIVQGDAGIDDLLAAPLDFGVVALDGIKVEIFGITAAAHGGRRAAAQADAQGGPAQLDDAGTRMDRFLMHVPAFD